MTTNTFEFTSVLDAPRAAVWAVVSTPAGINDELAPYLRMTMPATMRTLDVSTAPLGVRLFRSWILLGGVVPIDYDDLVLVALDPGAGFHERSSMATARVWEHVRTLRDEGAERCVLTDRLSFVPRFGWAAPVLRAIVPRVFAHRHRRLRRRFGDARDEPDGAV